MATVTRFLIFVPLLTALHGCGDESDPGIPATRTSDIHIQVTSTLAERLLLNLDERDTWPSNGVKIWLNSPTVSVNMSLHDSDTVQVHAWAGNENDFGVAMIRLDQGDTLYAISDNEFLELHLLGDTGVRQR